MASDHNDLTTLARGASMNAVGSVARALLLYAQSYALARLLGASGLGVYSLAVSVALLLSFIGELGLKFGVTRFVGAAHGQDKQATKTVPVIRDALLLTSLASLLLAVTLWFSAEFLANYGFKIEGLASAFRWIAPCIPIIAIGNILAAMTVACRVIKYKVFIQDFLQVGLQVVLTVALVAAGYDVQGAIGAYLIAGLVSLALLLVYSNRLLPWLAQVSRSPFQGAVLLRFSVPLMFAGLLGVLSPRIILLLVGYYRDPEEVAIFFVAYQTTVVGTLFLTSFNMVFAPIVADLANRHQFDRLQELYRTATRWIVTLALPVFVGLILVARPILTLFGEEFTAGTGALILLAFAQLINVSVGSVGLLLAMCDHPKMMTWNNLLGMVLSVALSLFLIPRFGLIGAAVGQAAMVAIVNIAGLVQVKMLIGIHPYSSSYRKPLLAIIGAGAVAFTVTYFLKLTSYGLWHTTLAEILVVGLSLSCTYAMLLWTMGWEPEDYEMMRQLRQQLNKRNEAADDS